MSFGTKAKPTKKTKATKPTLDLNGEPRCRHPDLKAFQGWLDNRVHWSNDGSERFGYVHEITRSGRLIVHANDCKTWSLWPWQVTSNHFQR